MTEEEKIFAGKLYCPADPDLRARKLRAHNLCTRYNAAFEDDAAQRSEILRALFASLEGGDGGKNLAAYADPDSPQYAEMIECIRRELKFTSLKYHRLDDMLAAAGGDPCRFCTYCWTGREE